MKSIACLLLAAAYALPLGDQKPAGFDMPAADSKFLEEIQKGLQADDAELPAAEGHGLDCDLTCYADCAVCPQPTCYVDALDCNVHLPAAGPLGSGQLQEYQAGSRAVTEAYSQQIPDRFYTIDAVSAQDTSTAANEVYNGVNVGTHTFEISGNIAVKERYDEHSGNARQGREKSNSCYHKEQRTELCDNLPAAIGGPCVCA